MRSRVCHFTKVVQDSSLRKPLENLNLLSQVRYLANGNGKDLRASLQVDFWHVLLPEKFEKNNWKLDRTHDSVRIEFQGKIELVVNHSWDDNQRSLFKDCGDKILRKYAKILWIFAQKMGKFGAPFFK